MYKFLNWAHVKGIYHLSMKGIQNRFSVQNGKYKRGKG